MNNIKGVLFDKDGTILDFDSIWVPVAVDLVKALISQYKLEDNKAFQEKLLSSIGIENGKVVQESLLICGTTQDISNKLAEIIININGEIPESFHRRIRDYIYTLVKNNMELIKPKGNVINVLKKLKSMGIKIGLATSDTHESARICLEKLEIIQYFDFIGADDGSINAKPNPELLYSFCENCSLKTEEIAVVGDSLSDMMFASNGNAALAIAVLSERSDRSLFHGAADYMISSVEELLDKNGKLMWC